MRLLLITGAGASRNLNAADTQPVVLMAGWADALRVRFGPSLSRLLGLDNVITGQDFEELLGELTRWIQLKDFNMRFALMTSGSDKREDGTVSAYRTALRHAELRGGKLETALHETLFEEFGAKRFDPQSASSAYDRLLRQIARGRPEQFICATTNYDRSLEIALREMGLRARTGFYHDGITLPRLTPDGLGTYEGQPSVLHLHGAVGWYRDPNGEIVEHLAGEPYRPQDGQPAVLYPSKEKSIEDSAVRALWVEFDKALDGATHVFVLGHALGDEHLVSRLQQVAVPLAVTVRHERDTPLVENLLPLAQVIPLTFSPNPKFPDTMIHQWGARV